MVGKVLNVVSVVFLVSMLGIGIWAGASGKFKASDLDLPILVIRHVD